MFGHPERSFYASELIREAGTGSGAAQRELARLEESGLIVTRCIGHQKHYQANAASPLYSELRNIVLNTVGLAEPLRDALKPLSSAIRAAFVYGSVAKSTDQSASDIDLMIISDSLTYGEIFGALERVTRNVGRKVNPTVYTGAEFSKRARTENAFVTRVLEQPKLWVIGSEDDLPIAACRPVRATSREGTSRCEGVCRPRAFGLGALEGRGERGELDRSATICGIAPSTKARPTWDERLVKDLIAACRKVAEKVTHLPPISEGAK